MRKSGIFMWVALAMLACVAFVPAKAGEITIQIGYENHPGEPIDEGAKEWKRLVEEMSKGTMKVELYPSSQLGTKNDIMDQMLAGDSVITLADGSFFAERGAPDFDISVAPYIVDSIDEFWKLLESGWWKEQEDILEKKAGMKLLAANWVYGTRHTLAIKPIRKVEDMAGMKIRVPNSPIFISTFEAMGAAPTPLPLGDVYTALQQGVVDGVENPLAVLYNGKFQEVAKYLTLDGHIILTTSWVCGADFFDSLTREQQEILVEAGRLAGIRNNQVVDEMTAKMLDMFRAEGVEIIEVDTAPFRQATRKVYSDPRVVNKWTPGLYERIQKELGK